MKTIPFQENAGGLVALLPDGRVRFVDTVLRPIFDAINAGLQSGDDIDFDQYIINDPLVPINPFKLTAPAIAFIETTNLCNLRCKHCYADSALKRPNEMSTEMILNLIDELADMGVLQVFLTGGEFFAHPDAIQILNHARSKAFTTQVFTNGTLITEEKLAAIPAGTSFFISFDTAVPERTIRGGMNFPKLKKCFEWMQKYNHVLRTAVSVHRHNIEDIEEIFEWCCQNGYPRPQWLETHPVGRALLHPDILLQPEDIDTVFEIYKRCMDRFVSPKSITENGDEPDAQDAYSIDTIKFCQSLEDGTQQEKCARSTVYINSAGDVYPCSNCVSSRSYKGGNLRESQFLDIWNDGFSEFRSITFSDFTGCQACPVQQSGAWCQFRCPPLAKNVSNNPTGCGATDYVKKFMLRSHYYWQDRAKQNLGLSLFAPRSTATNV